MGESMKNIKVGDAVKIWLGNDISGYQLGNETHVIDITKHHIIVSLNNPGAPAHGREMKFALTGFGVGTCHKYQLIKVGA